MNEEQRYTMEDYYEVQLANFILQLKMIMGLPKDTVCNIEFCKYDPMTKKFSLNVDFSRRGESKGDMKTEWQKVQ